MVNEYPSVKAIYDRRKTSSAVKPGTVEIEILHKGKRKWISTGVRILPDGFSWAINLKIVVVDDISEIPEHVSPFGINTFNLRLTKTIYQEP